MIRVVIAEDHNSLIDGIQSFLKNENDVKLVGFANDGEALCDLVAKKHPDVVITDIRMPMVDGITATQRIMKSNPEVKIIAFTMFDQDEAVQQMLSAGAKGYILKNSSLKDLLQAIRQVYAGSTYYDKQVKIPQSIYASKTSTPLTRRQLEILRLIALGKTNQEIADELFIGRTTVETHRKNMIRILNLKGAGELLRYALETKYKF
jgi:two-component system response regulator NreC